MYMRPFPSAGSQKQIPTSRPIGGSTDAGQPPHVGDSVDLMVLLQETCAALEDASGRDRVVLLPGSSERCLVPADVAAQLMLIVNEAIRNALKYAHPAGVPGRTAVSCNLGPDGAIAIHVTDDGVGLPEGFDAASDGNIGLRQMHAWCERIGAALAFKSTALGLDVSLHVPGAAIGSREGALLNGAANGHPGTDAGSDPRNGAHQPAALPGFASGLELLDALPAAVYMTDADGRITFYNEAASALWGCRPELGRSEFCGSWKLFWPDGTPLPHDECPMAMALAQQRPIRGMEAVAERPDGTRVPFMPYPTPLFDGSGALIGAINMLVDISERKRAEASIARHRDEQSALYQFTDRLFRAGSLPDIYDAALDSIQLALGCRRSSILLFDAAGVMRFVASRGLSDGYRQAVEGHSPWTRDAKDPQPICIDAIERADIADELKQTVKAEGIGALAFIPLMVKGALIGKFMTYYDAPHEFTPADTELAMTIARQLGFGVDQARADQDCRLLASIIETSGDAIVSKDLDGIVTSWNHGAECVFGYTADEMLGRSITTLIPPDRSSEEPRILERIRRGERVEPYETVRRRKDGTLIDVSLSVSPLKDANGSITGASKIARDVSEQKRAQQRQDLLTREIQHRTKNIFSVVQAVVARSFVGKHTVEEAERAALDRLHSLAQTHTMLLEHEWRGGDIAEVVRAEISPYAGRVTTDGPSLMLNARAAQNFALALHELTTNAAKYGALSNATGHVHVSWCVFKPNGHHQFRFRWEERGGPRVAPPKHRGFGTTVLELVMAECFETPPRIDFAPDGVRYEVIGSLEAMLQQG
jgi:PAS domain S-box-containing protein